LFGLPRTLLKGPPVAFESRLHPVTGQALLPECREGYGLTSAPDKAAWYLCCRPV